MQFEYLNSFDDFYCDFALDGRKVRLGFESEKFNPLDENDSANTENIELLEKLIVKD